MAREKRESGVARGADLCTKGGDYQRPLQRQKTVCIWVARQRKVRPEGGGRRAPRQGGCGLAFKVVFVIGTTGNGLCTGRRKHGVRRMAPPDYCEIDCGLLALEIVSKPGWTRFASQGFSEVEAGLECHANVGESSVAVLWTAFGSDSHWITRGRTGKKEFQNRNWSKYSRARTLYPQSECHSIGV